jgi:hypothetical protein
MAATAKAAARKFRLSDIANSSKIHRGSMDSL